MSASKPRLPVRGKLPVETRARGAAISVEELELRKEEVELLRKLIEVKRRIIALQQRERRDG